MAFLTQYPFDILVKQNEADGTYFNAPDFDKYMRVQEEMGISDIEVLSYLGCYPEYEIIFYGKEGKIIHETEFEK